MKLIKSRKNYKCHGCKKTIKKKMKILVIRGIKIPVQYCEQCSL